MKQRKQTKPSILWAVTLMAVFIAGIIIAVQPAAVPNDDERGLPFTPAGPPLFPERLPSIAEAKRAMGQDLAVPTWTPSGYSLQGIFIERSAMTIEFVFGPSPIPSGLMTSELVSSGYWILMVSQGAVDPESYTKYVVELTDGRVKPVMIGKYPGLLTCPGDGGSGLMWWMNNRTYDLATPVDTTSEEILRFAASVTPGP